MERIRLFHIYKDSLIAQAMHALMEHSLSCTIAGTASDVRDAVPPITEIRPDIVVCGVSPPEIDPIYLQRTLRQSDVSTPVFVFTAESKLSTIREVLSAGVSGYLVSAETTAEGLGLALQSVRAGLTVLGPSAKRAWTPLGSAPGSRTTADNGGLNPRNQDLLTERERVILRLLTEGLTNKQIAERLGIGLRTAQLHLGRLLTKVGARSRLEAVRIALERNLLPSSFHD